MKTTKKISKPLMVTFAIFLLIITYLPKAEAYQETSTISKDTHVKYYLIGKSGDEFEIEFTVTQGDYADLYIMTRFEYNEHYMNNKSFNASFLREKTKSVQSTWTQPDDQDYYLVVDNEDNARESDAEPSGDITYRIEYNNKTAEEEVEKFFGFALMVVALCCGIIIVIIIVVIYLLLRKKKEPPMIGPQYRQGYQPPYGGHPPY